MIQPGQTELVEFSAPTPQQAGTFVRQIGVASNDRNNPSVILQGETTVLTALRKQPEVVNFGTLKRDTPEQKMTVTLTRGDGGPLRLRISSIGHSQIKPELREIEAGEKYELDVTIGPPWPNGMLQGAVVLETGVEQVPLETFHVFASVVPRLQAVPPRLMFLGKPKTDLDLTARLTWDGEPAKILDVTTTDPTMSATLVDENDGQSVVLHMPADYDPQNKNGNVTVKTDDPFVPVLQIPFTIVNQPGPTTPGQPPTVPGRLAPNRVSAQPPSTTNPAVAPTTGAQK
jgi:hypothetical protein